MKALVQIVSVLTTLLFPASTLASECTDLARTIGREARHFGNREQIDILNTSNLCTSHYESATSSQKTQIEASYSLFSGGASGSSDQIKVMQEGRCENHYGSYWSGKVTSSDLETVSQVGADVVTACLNQASFRLVDLELNDSAVVASFRYSGDGDTDLSGVIINPPSVAKCNLLYDGQIRDASKPITGVKLKSGKTATLDCQRVSSKNSDGQRIYDAGIIGMSTSANVSQFPLVAFADPPIGIDDAQKLNSRITEMGDRIQNMRSHSKLACRPFNGSPVRTKYPKASAVMPPAERGTMALTGGGCQTADPDPYNWMPIIYSRPNADGSGWECMAADPPGLPTVLTLTATAVYCEFDPG